MKTRVFTRGLAICMVIWVLVVVAQGYFRELRSTAETLGKVVEDEEFADWSGRDGEPEGDEGSARDRRIRAVAASLSRQEYNPETRGRLGGLRDEFYSKLSRGERSLFVESVVSSLETYIVIFDAMPPEARKKLSKKAVKEARDELPEELLSKYSILEDTEGRDRIGEVGWRAALEEKSPDEAMELLQLIEIAGELNQRRRMPRWEGGQGNE